MTEATTIPCLPCISMDRTLEFYQTLAFEVTYRQKSPNGYAVIRYGACELHLFDLKGLKAEEGYSTCCVIVPEVEPLHQQFSASLREKHGKLPIAGFPRITRFKPGQGRFTVTDPNGNSVIFVKRSAHGVDNRVNQTGLAKAIENASKLRDESGDDESAAKVLDVALGRYGGEAVPLDRARALAARAELAVALGDSIKLSAVRAELQSIPLSDADRLKYRHELDAAEELERSLS